MATGLNARCSRGWASRARGGDPQRPRGGPRLEDDARSRARWRPSSRPWAPTRREAGIGKAAPTADRDRLRDVGDARAGVRARRRRVRRGHGRARRRPLRDGLQRQRAARAGGRAQADRGRPRPAGDGPRLRHRRGRRPRPRLRQRRAPRPGRPRRRVGHRLPAAARPARPRRRRGALCLGVGGRDLSAEVGGLSTWRRCGGSTPTRPPSSSWSSASRRRRGRRRVESHAARLATPVVLALLGPGRPDLTAATERSSPTRPRRSPPGPGPARNLRAGQRTDSGGAGSADCSWAAPTRPRPGWSSRPNSAPGTRSSTSATTPHRRPRPPDDRPDAAARPAGQEAADPETEVILLDVVLGHGADPDPAAALAPATRGGVPVVVAVVGTDDDPQDLDGRSGARRGRRRGPPLQRRRHPPGDRAARGSA